MISLCNYYNYYRQFIILFIKMYINRFLPLLAVLHPEDGSSMDLRNVGLLL
jgi:hypothetical protein